MRTPYFQYFQYFLVCFMLLLSVSCAKEEQPILLGVEPVIEAPIKDTRISMKEFKALSLEDKLKFDYWEVTRVFYQTHHNRDYNFNPATYIDWNTLPELDFVSIGNDSIIRFDNDVPLNMNEEYHTLFSGYDSGNYLKSKLNDSTFHFLKEIGEYGDSSYSYLGVENDTLLTIDNRYPSKLYVKGSTQRLDRIRMVLKYSIQRNKIR